MVHYQISKMPREVSPGRKSSATPLVAKDRIITSFPEPFHPDATPHQKLSFHPRVKDAVSQNRTGTVGLKICKAVLVGDVAVGKSCLVNRFCHNVFDRDYKATIGVDFEVEKFSVLSVPFTLQVWDTAGQERFKCIAASYYRGANLVIVVFDLTDPESLSNVRKWKNDACESAAKPIVFVIGTKKDLLSDGPYKDMEADAVKLAHELGAEYWPVSSLTGENVKEFFFRAVSLTFDKLVQEELGDNNSPAKQIGSDLIKIQDKPNNRDLYEKNKKKNGCC